MKAVCDALNGVAYGDDSQIVSAHIAKRYSSEPRVEVAAYDDAPMI
jgi:Holliday junction resolvase RusA-like endonuclease